MRGENVISGDLIVRGRIWRMIGVYLPPSGNLEEDLYHITSVVTSQTGKVVKVILLGDLNVIFGDTSDRSKWITAVVSSLNVTNLMDQFFQKGSRSNKITWNSPTGVVYT